jgi:dienelactone hydrolase
MNTNRYELASSRKKAQKMQEKRVHWSFLRFLRLFAAIPLLFPPAVQAWPGHSFDEWKAISTWIKPEIKTDQAGRTDLAPLLASGSGGHIDEIRGWESKRAEYSECITKILGSPSGNLKPPQPEAELLGEEQLDDHIRRHIRIRSELDDWITAYLLIPNGVSQKQSGERRRAAMICVHQTVAQGKEEPCGIKGDPQLAFALQLVRRGFVCIAPDMIGFGERIPPGTAPYHDSAAFYRKHPNWSFMGKMIWDMSRVVDYLRTLSFVDPLQIGSIGHSHGAYTTLFAAAFEPRISLAIASCGFTTFRSDPEPDRWSHLTALIPQLGTYLPEVKNIPFDWQHICALTAPRPLLVWYATQDTIFPETDNLDVMLTDVGSVYGLYGAADDLKWHAFDGPHKFPDDGREIAYRWLEERFFPTDDLKKTPTNVAEWDRQKQTLRRVIVRSIGKPAHPPCPLDTKVLATEQMPGYERRLIEYQTEPGERVQAYVCLPQGQGKRPGVLVLHQTAAEGKAEPVGLGTNKSLAFASDLAGRGYVTLAPDSIAAGDRVDHGKPFDTRGHYARHPYRSALGQMLYDSIRALDVLVSFEQVDPQRIGAIGHSLGAEEALMLAAFDERVTATISSCGYATFAAEKNRTRWARNEWFSYMPKLRPVFLRSDLPAWDWPDVVRMIAPRALYQHTTENDQIFPESISAYQECQSARAAWDLYSASDRLANVLKPGKHAIAEETKEEMYKWLDRQLGR